MISSTWLAAKAGYQRFQQVYPQRTEDWDRLAQWERDRWVEIVKAILAVYAAAEAGDE